MIALQSTIKKAIERAESRIQALSMFSRSMSREQKLTREDNLEIELRVLDA